MKMYPKKVMSLFLSVIVLGNVFYSSSCDASAAKKPKLSKKKITLQIKQTCKLKLKFAKAGKVKWNSSNPKIASVKKGAITAKRKGNCKIAATYCGQKYQCTVQVKGGTDSQPGMPKPQPAAGSSTAKPQPTAGSSTAAPQPTDGDGTGNAASQAGGINFTVKKYDPQMAVASLYVENNTDNMIIMGISLMLERNENGVWQSLARQNNSIPAVAMYVMPGDHAEWDVNLGADYGDLPAGQYRISKELASGERIYAEFMIQ